MLFKTRIRIYDEKSFDKLTAFMLGNGLAQNVSREQQFLTGDFVQVWAVDNSCLIYMSKVKQMQKMYGVCAEVVVG